MFSVKWFALFSDVAMSRKRAFSNSDELKGFEDHELDSETYDSFDDEMSRNRMSFNSDEFKGLEVDELDADTYAIPEKKRKKTDELGEKKEKNRKFLCTKCAKGFDRSFNCKRHEKNCQNNDKNKNWKCTDCPFKFYRRKEWKDHLAKFHDKQIKDVTIDFDTHDEFIEWKRNEENENFCSFIKQNVSQGYERFSCNRHGNPRKQISNKGERRNLKGLCHTGLICPAGMTVSLHDNGKVSVNYTPDHTSDHSQDKDNLEYVRMPKEVQEQIETCVQVGATPENVSTETFHSCIFR